MRDHRGRQLGEDPLRLVARRGGHLRPVDSRLDDRERLDEQRLSGARRVVDDPRHARALGGANREHRATAALGEERLLQRVADVRRAGDARQLLTHPYAADRSSERSLPQQRRRGIAQVRAVVLDRTVDRPGERLERRRDDLEQLEQARRELGALPDDPPRLERDWIEREIARSSCGCSVPPRSARTAAPRGSAAPASVCCARPVEQGDRLGRQRLPVGDLCRIARRHERARRRRSVIRLGARCKALENRRQLERGQRLRVHAASVDPRRRRSTAAIGLPACSVRTSRPTSPASRSASTSATAQRLHELWDEVIDAERWSRGHR